MNILNISTMRETSAVPCLLIILQLSSYADSTSAYRHKHHADQKQEQGTLSLSLAPDQYPDQYQHHSRRGGQSSRQTFVSSGKNPRSVPREQNCPVRNEFDVKAAGMLCVRRCTADQDCTNDRKLCLCDGLCGLSCIRPEKECPELPDPENGQVSLDGRHFQDSASYTCDSGYQLVGVEQVTCQASGRWSGVPPACKESSGSAPSPYYCSQPPAIDHASHNGSRDQNFYSLDSSVSYRCYPGYDRAREGFSHSKCFFLNGTATWYGPDLICHPIQCGPPDDIPNSKRVTDCTTFRCQATYTCLPGFEARGERTRICQPDGTWTATLPECDPVQCGLPENPVNGKALFSAVAYESVVSYECKYGYMIVGSNQRKCGTDRRWTGRQPECREINCGPPGFGSLPNGWLEGSKTTLHAVVAFKCIEGMKFEGESDRTTCNADGKWSHPLPACLAPCIVPEVTSGEVTGYSVGNKAEHGETISINCSKNYETVGNSTPVQCSNGTWTQLPRCWPARCKQMPSPPSNGMIVVPDTAHGSLGLYQCKDGFTLIGRNTTACQYGEWSGETPSCDETHCPFPGYLPNGKVLLVGNMGLYDYRPYVKRITNDRQIMFDCDKGYKLKLGDPMGATCLDGRWSPAVIPTCVKENHPAIKWLDKRSIRKQDLDELFPSRKKRSLSEGGDISCPQLNLKLMTTHILKLSDNSSGLYNSAGTTVKITCAEGYRPNTPRNKVRCRKGEWKPSQPHCLPKSCKVPSIQGGTYRHNNMPAPVKTHIGHSQTIFLACNSGYRLQGLTKLPCNYGVWVVPKLPRCVGVPCMLPSIPMGQYVGDNHRAEQMVLHDTLVDYECSQGFLKKSSRPLQCKTGSLVPSGPQCNEDLAGPKAEPFQNTEQNEEPLRDDDLRTELFQDTFPDSFSDTNTHSCSPPEELDSTLMFLSQVPSEEDDNYLPDELHTEGAIDYSNISDIVDVEDTETDTDTEDPYEDIEDSVDNPYQDFYPNGTVVQFRCTQIKPGKYASWQIRCDSGLWVGQSVECTSAGDTLDEVTAAGFNMSCRYSPAGDNLVAFYKDLQVTKEISIPAGEELVLRCSDIGKYRLEGPQKRRCVGGYFDGRGSQCVGLNQAYDYKLDKPPTILFRHEGGPIAQSNVGELIVFPGTTLHMECLFLKRFGTPVWSTRRTRREEYPQGWAQGVMRDSTLEFRLSIFQATDEDTGQYTCTTPPKHSTSIRILVMNVSCPPIIPTRGLEVSTNQSILNTRAQFSCNNGKTLLGSSELVCLPSGLWSDIVPACEKIFCPPIMELLGDTNLQVSTLTHEAGGRVAFSCSPNYELVGPSSANCQQSGHWSLGPTPPTCQPKLCQAPLIPLHGNIHSQYPGQQSYRVADIVKFHCNTGFMMQGAPVTACTEDKTWSKPSPQCVTACTYPGTNKGGSIDKVKFYYQIGETVRFSCAVGLEMVGPPLLKCLGTGSWSGGVPGCKEL